MIKYLTLLKVLEALRKEAPEDYRIYHPKKDDLDKVNRANSRAYIHLLLKAKFNLLDFEKREKFVTDDSQDGGIDAYYIDHENKKIYFIQSKFRTNNDNFMNKSIELEEINKMDIDRISRGERIDENGIKYNNKIQRLIQNLSEIEQISRYDFNVIILANVSSVLADAMGKLLNFPFEVYNYERAYEELVFPIVRGTVHQATNISVNLNLGSKNNYTMDYWVEDEEFTTSVQLFFVPILEIAKLMSSFKNSILKFNPRSYLGASDNEVNSSIKDSVINRSGNVFALFNNGITLLSDKTSYTSRTGREGIGELSLLNPQIINGGQTAYTLSTVLEDDDIDNKVFDNKEVLLKVITFDQGMKDELSKQRLIDELSLTTNNQSKVTVADRKSNSNVQIDFQKYIYNNYGYFYHRKTGEFTEGIEKGYISKDQIISRNTIIRIIYAMNGRVNAARRNSEDALYNMNDYEKFFNIDIGPEGYDRIYFLYIAFKYLEKKEKKENSRSDYGEGLRYGKYAIINVISKFLTDEYFDRTEDSLNLIVDEILDQWKEFERMQSNKKSNIDYFYEKEEILKQENKNGKEKMENLVITTRVEDFDNYYKGSTINKDLNDYEFKITKIEETQS
ncbi:MAG: AIPR family protein [Anaerococcus sp.]|nr:AIPR family protein [Anaerococcus sp.]